MLRVLFNEGIGIGIGIGLSLTIVVVAGLLSGGGLALGYLLYPRFIARRRGRRIGVTLPHVTIFMRALSQTGQNPTTLIHELAALESVYGDIALEFDVIRKDTELYNDGLLTALENAKSLTPSDRLREFFDDFVSVLESGGGVRPFLDQKVAEQLQRTEDELEELLESLVTLAEAYVSLVFVGPLLLLVVLILFGLTGSDVMDYLHLLTYVGIPLGILVSMVAIHQLLRPYRLETGVAFEQEKPESKPPETSESWFLEYTKQSHRRRFLRRFQNPLVTLQEKPLYSLSLTVPVALGFVVFAVVTGILEPTQEAYLTEPVRFTTGFVVIPMLVITVVLMAFHEVKRRRQRSLEERFPDALYTLASANERGIGFVDGVELVSRRYDDPIASEFRTVSQDIELEDDVARALTAFANRLRIARLTLTVSVIRDLTTSTNELAVPLRSLADNLETRLSLQRARRREMEMYAIVIILGVLVYLLVILVFESFFLPEITAIPTREPDLFVGEIPVIPYRTVFFHSALIQAFGNGLLLGLLTDDSLFSGLKYSNALVALVLLSFFLMP
ncbi:type II secretion system F family protein [Halopenitus sp. H-Gu1]|uniref:type II secretion system F family protein n=1 Tax=Halopenitus sp. H-Gu1 TaxID=3242697 RepID=UPI00359D444C